jgi:hypothetical protein
MIKNVKLRVVHYLLVFVVIFLAASCEKEVIETETQNINVQLKVLNQGIPVSGNWYLKGKDRRGGDNNWNGIFSIEGSTIQIDLNYDQYTLKVETNGGNKEVTLSKQMLINRPEVTISLTDDDYHRYTTSDGNLTLLLPKDPTDPFFEIRILDNMSLGYCYIDRAFWKDGKPVRDMIYVVFTDSMIDCTAFKSFKDLSGKYGTEWDEADSALYYETTCNGYETIYHQWKF